MRKNFPESLIFVAIAELLSRRIASSANVSSVITKKMWCPTRPLGAFL